MVAHPGRGVLTWPLTCGIAAVAVVRETWRSAEVRPVGTGRKRPAAGLCAEYVLKFRPTRHRRWIRAPRLGLLALPLLIGVVSPPSDPHARRGTSGRPRPVLAMHKHAAWTPVGSAVVGLVNGAESS